MASDKGGAQTTPVPADPLTEQQTKYASEKLMIVYRTLGDLLKILMGSRRDTLHRTELLLQLGKVEQEVRKAYAAVVDHVRWLADAQVHRDQLEQAWQEETSALSAFEAMSMQNMFGADAVPKTAMATTTSSTSANNVNVSTSR